MTPASRLAEEIDAFEAIVHDLAAVAARTDPERRSVLTGLRRRLSDQICLMRDAGPQAFDEPADANEFRSRISSVLSVVAMHQANWPAVSIDQGRAAYRASAIAATSSNRAFIEWTRAALARNR